MTNGNCCQSQKTAESEKSCCKSQAACPCPLGKILPQNIGGADRLARLVIGLALISLVFVGPQTPWGWVGLIPLATAITGWCGLYTLLKVSTRGKSCCGGNCECQKDGQSGGKCCSA